MLSKPFQVFLHIRYVVGVELPDPVHEIDLVHLDTQTWKYESAVVQSAKAIDKESIRATRHMNSWDAGREDAGFRLSP